MINSEASEPNHRNCEYPRRLICVLGDCVGAQYTSSRYGDCKKNHTCRYHVFCFYVNHIERDFLVRVVFLMRWTRCHLRRLLLDNLGEEIQEAEQEGQPSSQFSGVSHDANGRWEAYVYFQRKKMYIFVQSKMFLFFICQSLSVSGIGL